MVFDALNERVVVRAFLFALLAKRRSHTSNSAMFLPFDRTHRTPSPLLLLTDAV